MTIRITAPEATAIRFFDGERWEWWDSRCLDRDGVYEFGRSMNSGEYTFAAQAAYDEGFDWETFDDWENFDAQSELHWTAMSDVIHVSVSAAGDTDAAVIETIGTVTRGELLPVVITSAGEADSPGMATSLYAEIRNEDGWNMGEGTGVNGLTFEDYPVTLLLPTGNLGEGRYYASVHSSTIGYNSTEAYAAFDIAEPEEDSFIFEVQDGLILDQEFSMSAYAKDASWIDVNIRNTGDGDEFSWGPFDGDHV